MKKEKLFKFYRSYRLYIFPAIVALSSLFLIVFVIFPQIAKLILNQRDVGELINKSKFLETKVFALESYNSEDLSRKLEIALNAYPGSKDYGAVMGLLQQLVAQSGFTVASIALGSTTKVSSRPESYELKLEIAGVKPNLPILLNNLESSSRLIRVNSIDVASSNNQAALNVSLVVEILFSALPQSLGSTDSPLPDLSQKDEEVLAALAEAAPSSISQPQATPGTSIRGKTNPFE